MKVPIKKKMTPVTKMACMAKSKRWPFELRASSMSKKLTTIKINCPTRKRTAPVPRSMGFDGKAQTAPTTNITVAAK